MKYSEDYIDNLLWRLDIYASDEGDLTVKHLLCESGNVIKELSEELRKQDENI